MAQEKKNVSQFTWLNDLASEKVGGKILFATDDWFATAENLLKVESPVWKEDVFTDCGKWMDGWESRRKRIPGHDWCIIQLGLSGIIHGFDVDTCFFTGNYPPKVSIQGACLNQDLPARPAKQIGTKATNEEFKQIDKLNSESWEEIVPISPMKPGYQTMCHNFFSAKTKKRWTHIRLNYYPDGGCARLHVFGQAVPDWSLVPYSQPIDLVSVQYGGICLGCSNYHYGHPRNMIGFGQAANMGDGWETARRLDRPSVLKADRRGILQIPGSEWCVFQLGQPGNITSIEIDTNHFKGNYPDSCKIEACLIKKQMEEDMMKHVGDANWKTLLLPQKLNANKQHLFSSEIIQCGLVNHVRVTIAPDGGISRMRILGYRTGTQNSLL